MESRKLRKSINVKSGGSADVGDIWRTVSICCYLASEPSLRLENMNGFYWEELPNQVKVTRT